MGNFFNWGLIELGPDQMKRTKNSRYMHMIFNVQSGTVEVRVHENEFVVHKQGVWQVPRGMLLFFLFLITGFVPSSLVSMAAWKDLPLPSLLSCTHAVILFLGFTIFFTFLVSSLYDSRRIMLDAIRVFAHLPSSSTTSAVHCNVTQLGGQGRSQTRNQGKRLACS